MFCKFIKTQYLCLFIIERILDSVALCLLDGHLFFGGGGCKNLRLRICLHREMVAVSK